MRLNLRNTFTIILSFIIFITFSGCSSNKNESTEKAIVDISVDYQKTFGSTATPMYICIDGEKITLNGNSVEP